MHRVTDRVSVMEKAGVVICGGGVEGIDCKCHISDWNSSFKDLGIIFDTKLKVSVRSTGMIENKALTSVVVTHF